MNLLCRTLIGLILWTLPFRFVRLKLSGYSFMKSYYNRVDLRTACNDGVGAVRIFIQIHLCKYIYIWQMSHWRKFHLIHTLLTNLDAVRYTRIYIFYLYAPNSNTVLCIVWQLYSYLCIWI